LARGYTRTADYLSHAGIPVQQVPITIYVNLKAPSATGTWDFFGEVKSSNAYFMLRASKLADTSVTWRYMGKASFLSSFAAIWNTASLPPTWNTIAGVSESTTSHKLYAGGLLRNTQTTSCNPNVDSGTTYIGRSFSATLGYTGTIGVVAIWSAALNADEIAGLSGQLGTTPTRAAMVPWRVRPESLVACWPSVSRNASTEYNLAGTGYDMTVNGSPTIEDGEGLGWTDHPIAA